MAKAVAESTASLVAPQGDNTPTTPSPVPRVKNAKKVVVYKITCTANGRVYIGQSVDPNCRFKQHAKHPPRRMASDARRYQPFALHFDLAIVNKEQASRRERQLIAEFQSTGPNGYNDMRSTGDVRVWTMLAYRRVNKSA